MRKVLLLVFIHGFKGGDDTFGTFPEHLRALVGHALPKIDVFAVTYPKFETRGELKDCVERFHEWLQNKVIDLEVERMTPSPTVDPAVHVMLVGHSMGGIVAAETFLTLANEQPIPPQHSRQNPERPNYPSNTTLNSSTSTSHPNNVVDNDSASLPSFMFPHIQGILAFDTPYLGLAPGMVAHSLEGGHKVVANAYNTYSDVANMFGWGSKSEPGLNAASSASTRKAIGALPAPATSSTADAAAAPKWQSWGKYAMFAGAAGAVVAGGAAALYSQREKLSAGWQWAGDHLLFVGELFKPEFLRRRVDNVEAACRERDVGWANFYTNLGKGARDGYGITASLAGKERTFCNLPVRVSQGSQKQSEDDEVQGGGMQWIKATNDKAKDETTGHVSMFFPRDNPGFYALGDKAKEKLASWVDQGWYQSSEGPSHETKDEGATLGEIGDGWEKPDYADAEVKAKERERDQTGYSTGFYEENFMPNDWEGVESQRRDDRDLTEDGFRMRDDDGDEDLEDSVIVEKAADGQVPLPKPRNNTGL
ncbi:hypothetical protein B0A52_02049 [Exophiala mesophila]|uniref:DUF676 domain-containing protein n=1 Tax=Exophiala mesophila TaxID=212818 RepID=A0A438NEQ8_EXOME|nr:hypothetical protein B0A52_02049 [Exophiala mesophila]